MNLHLFGNTDAETALAVLFLEMRPQARVNGASKFAEEVVHDLEETEIEIHMWLRSKCCFLAAFVEIVYVLDANFGLEQFTHICLSQK